jgi:gamma-glutamyltranspeptidase
MHHQWLPDTASIEQRGGPADAVLAALRAMGHKVDSKERQGDAESIWIAPDGTAYGINDKRSADSKASPANLTPPAGGR